MKTSMMQAYIIKYTDIKEYVKRWTELQNDKVMTVPTLLYESETWVKNKNSSTGNWNFKKYQGMYCIIEN
jgi:hypothetical protein